MAILREKKLKKGLSRPAPAPDLGFSETREAAMRDSGQELLDNLAGGPDVAEALVERRQAG
jgi:hypothetical protein